MRNVFAVAAMVGLVVGGCASGPRGKVAAEQPKEAREIAGRLLEIMDACEKKDFERLESYHLYGPKFTKFSTESAGRLEAEVARKGERDGLSAVNGLSMRADGLKIDVFGKAGIATFVLNYSFKVGEETIEKQAKTTMVLVKEGGQWRIAHEHLSGIGGSSQ
jgi:ketosteroid isomerase-like protein